MAPAGITSIRLVATVGVGVKLLWGHLGGEANSAAAELRQVTAGQAIADKTRRRRWLKYQQRTQFPAKNAAI